MLLASCSQDVTEDNKVELAKKVVYASAESDSRAYFEQNGDVYNHKWAQDDEIGVFDKTTAISEYLLIDGADTKDGVFLQISMPDGGKTLANSYAIYPYSTTHTMTAEGVFNITFPAEQSYDAQHPESYGRNANILVGVGATDNFAFKNVCGFLEIRLKGSATISEIKLRGNNNERIAGAGIISYNGSADPRTTMLSTATNEITLTMDSGVALDAQVVKSFVIALPPTNFTKGFTVTTSAAEFSTSKSITISRNRITPMAVVEVEEVVPEVPETWKIYYTATEKLNLSCSAREFGADMIAHKYDSATGEGVVIFDGPVTMFGSGFAFNESLTGIVVPDSVTEFNWFAFSQCYNLASVNIPDGITTITESMFEYCESLKNIELPNSVTTIEPSAFHSCSALSAITLGSKMASIGEYAFYGCEALSRVEFLSTTPPTLSDSAFYINPDSSKNPTIYVPDEAFTAYCSSSWREEYKSWIAGNEPIALNELIYTTTDGNIITPFAEDFGVGLLSNTYENGRGKMVFDGNIAKIGSSVFKNCTTLKSLRMPNSITEIGDNAFYGCSSLTSIIIPNSVTSIGKSAFSNCSSLISITIPDGVTSIGTNTFSECTSLISITIPDGVTSIGTGTFSECTSLISITIPDSVTSIGNNAFWKCSSLTSITIPNSVKKIAARTFCWCSSLTSIIIPNKVTSIGDSAFNNCSSLTSIIIPNSVTEIASRAFSQCSSLERVIISDNVTKINSFTFEFCSSLREVVIGKKVEYLGEAVFYKCNNLKIVYCKPVSPPTIYVDISVDGDYSAIPRNSGMVIYVPRSSYSTYTGYYDYDNGSARVFNWYKYKSYIYPYDF